MCVYRCVPNHSHALNIFRKELMCNLIIGTSNGAGDHCKLQLAPMLSAAASLPKVRL